MNLGWIYGVIASLFFTLMAMTARYSNLSAHELTFIRSLYQCIISIFIIKNQKISFIGNNPPLLLLRGIFGFFALMLYFISLKKIPFSNAVAIQNLSPIFAFLIACFIKIEKFTLSAFFGISLSFLGVFQLYYSDFELIDLFLFFLALASSILSASSYVTISFLRHKDNAHTILLYFSLVSIVLICPFVNYTALLSSNFEENFKIIILVFSSHMAQLFLTKAYQTGHVGIVSQTQYLNLVFASFFGFFIFNEDWSFKKNMALFLILFGLVLHSNLKFFFRKI